MLRIVYASSVLAHLTTMLWRCITITIAFAAALSAAAAVAVILCALLVKRRTLQPYATRKQQQQQKPANPRSSDPPAYFICPITADVMEDPVVAVDGFTYERSAITRWLRQQQGMRRSPMTNKPMGKMLLPNHSLQSSIMEWHKQQ
jgi:hypothetical protein